MPSRFERLRAFIERVAFAGLKPDQEAKAPKKSKIKSLIRSAEELASLGLQPEESPLPKPNRLRHRIGVIAGLLVVGVFCYVLVGFLRRPAQQNEATGPPPAPVQIVPPGLKIEKNKDLEVTELEFDKRQEPKIITGTLRNRTDRQFAKCEISFHVTNKGGTQLGAVDTTVQNVAPHGAVKFRIPVLEKEADFVMVRDLRPE